MIKAVIFDFDGIIIDSEPLWVEAEIEVFETIGITLTPDLCRQTTGLNTHDTLEYWFKIYQWKGKSRLEVYREIMEAMQILIREKVELMDGFPEVLRLFSDLKMPMAVASASPLELIATALKKFHLLEHFKIINSGEKEEVGKPHPALYLGAANKLGVEPVNCVAFEDSFNGAISAKAARMKLVAVPDSHDYMSTRFDFADLKISSMKDFKKEQLDFLNTLK